MKAFYPIIVLTLLLCIALLALQYYLGVQIPAGSISIILLAHLLCLVIPYSAKPALLQSQKLGLSYLAITTGRTLLLPLLFLIFFDLKELNLWITLSFLGGSYIILQLVEIIYLLKVLVGSK